VAASLARETPAVLTGGPAERSLCETVLAMAGGHAINLAGETTLGGFAAVLRGARIVITNDTGASHLAVAVGTPSVTISSGSDVPRWAPLDAKEHPVLWRDAACRPCTFETCPFGHECSEVSVEEVLSAAQAVLNDTTRGRAPQGPQ
jgi:ADP-heptose:LPS heptosyltransferase